MFADNPHASPGMQACAYELKALFGYWSVAIFCVGCICNAIYVPVLCCRCARLGSHKEAVSGTSISLPEVSVAYLC